MPDLIKPERLAATFVQLCEIDSPSLHEKALADHLRGLFTTEFKADILEDDSASQTGSDTGNLVIRIGDHHHEAPTLFFNCHLDTVEPARGVKVRRSGDTFTSAGATILGADDKAGIAMLIELARCFKEHTISGPPLEFVFTTCEEIGLRGAKHFDFRLLRAPAGFALDSAGIDLAVIGAPAANGFKATVRGLAAHAGLHPEKGVNAIQLAARAVARLPQGRLDEQSTANIGLFSGGQATNIVPELAVVEGEVRSHDPRLLVRYTNEIKAIFEQTVAASPNSTPQLPNLEFTVEEQFPAMDLQPQSPVLRQLQKAAAQLGRNLRYTVAGGGSDANIFTAHGRPTAILGTGMTDVHTTDESITLSAMVRTTELLLALAKG
ncbi:MAG: M20/M25/M40 family metallo-hydrolase [Desulfurivibrio sp.]|nr:M20/M25/M40 family metallo-hydrolase [Desulfurivibrio sp.]